MRVHLRIVSRIGHSHAVSMCACPVAITRCALVAARRVEQRSQLGAGAGDVGAQRRAPAPTCGGTGAGGGRRAPSCASARRPRRGRARAPRPRCRSAPGRPAGTGRAVHRRRCRATRAATARTAGTTGSTPPPTGSSPARASASTRWLVRRGWMPCTGRPASSTISPSHWNPAASARNPRSMIASTRWPAQCSGIVAGEHEPRGPPRRPPGGCRRRTAPARRATVRP